MALLAWLGREVQPTPSVFKACVSCPFRSRTWAARRGRGKQTRPPGVQAHARTALLHPRRRRISTPPTAAKYPGPTVTTAGANSGRRSPDVGRFQTHLLIPVRAMCCDVWIWKRTTQPGLTPGFGLRRESCARKLCLEETASFSFLVGGYNKQWYP